MTETTKLESALHKFDLALSRFEVVAAHRQGEGTKLATVSAEALALRNDQQRLVRDLNLVKTKAAELVDTSKQAAVKIDSAMSRIRSVLHSNSGG
jgi:Domain of unknown function (DUF4164)